MRSPQGVRGLVRHMRVMTRGAHWAKSLTLLSMRLADSGVLATWRHFTWRPSVRSQCLGYRRCALYELQLLGEYTQSERDPEPVAQGRGELARPRRRPYQGEVRKIVRIEFADGAFADDDIDARFLHGWIKYLLDGAVESVYLIHK